MMPMLDGKTLNEAEFDKLDETVKKEFEDKSNIVQEQIFQAIGQIKAIEKEADKKIEEWQSNIALLTINVHINSIKSNFKRNKKISTFMDNVKKDILKNISIYTTPEAVQNPAMQNAPRQEMPKPWLNYRVNLFVDNSNLQGSPVVMDSNYSYQNLFGRLEYENHYGMLKTDYTMLKPGLLHKANGGYIILQAKDLIQNPYSYESLKKALTVRELNIENGMDQRSSMVMVSLKPEPIPLDVKVLLVGSGNLYYSLL